MTLTQKMQGKKGFNWNTVMAVMLRFIYNCRDGRRFLVDICTGRHDVLPESASEHGVAIDDMFLATTILTLIVFVITQTLLFGFSFFYRFSDKRKAHYLPHNNTIEKIWTIVPAVVLTILVVFGFFTWQRIENTEQRLKAI